MIARLKQRLGEDVMEFNRGQILVRVNGEWGMRGFERIRDLIGELTQDTGWSLADASWETMRFIVQRATSSQSRW